MNKPVKVGLITCLLMLPLTAIAKPGSFSPAPSRPAMSAPSRPTAAAPSRPSASMSSRPSAPTKPTVSVGKPSALSAKPTARRSSTVSGKAHEIHNTGRITPRSRKNVGGKSVLTTKSGKRKSIAAKPYKMPHQNVHIHSHGQSRTTETPKTAIANDITAVCKDETYSRDPNRKTACANHGGVKIWYGAKKAQKHH